MRISVEHGYTKYNGDEGTNDLEVSIDVNADDNICLDIPELKTWIEIPTDKLLEAIRTVQMHKLGLT